MSGRICVCLCMQMNGETDKISIIILLVTHRGTKSSGIQRATAEVKQLETGVCQLQLIFQLEN